MSETEFAVYREGKIVRYTEENVKAGYWSPVEALDRACEAHQRYIPDGLKTKNHIFFKIEDAKQDCRVGTIWLSRFQRGAADRVYLRYLYRRTIPT